MAIRNGDGTQQQQHHKSTVLGASANLINAIVGAGIVGIPYAIQQCGFVTGVVLVIIVACLAEKSLRMLVETASHVHVTSYESLFQVAFGPTWGFAFLSSCMGLLAYGSMVTYLIIVKDVFPSLLLDDGEMQTTEKQMILIAISFCIMVPISCQRDMAQLSKTSRINVLCDLIMVSLVVYKSPLFSSTMIAKDEEDSSLVTQQEQDIDSTTTSSNLLEKVMFIIHSASNNTTSPDAWTFRPDTVFVGLGVLSFAFVCQHSAFIIAGSLPRARQQWPQVTKIGLSACGMLALVNGIAGFISYGDDTEGNILNNLGTDTTAKVARAMLGTTMIFVYPLESFVARHALVALLFHNNKKTSRNPNRSAATTTDDERTNDDDDDAVVREVLNCTWKRITLTISLYVCAVIPALICDDLGRVLAVVGTIGGSCLSYIAPGASFLAIHGQQFLELVGCHSGGMEDGVTDQSSSSLGMVQGKRRHNIMTQSGNTFGTTILWYVSLMPLWCGIASTGCINVARHNNLRQYKLLNSKNQEGNSIELVVVSNKSNNRSSTEDLSSTSSSNNTDNDMEPLVGHHHNHTTHTSKIDATATHSTILKKDWTQQHRSTMPTVRDFWIAIGYILFGTVALVVGLYFIFAESSSNDTVVRR